MLLDYLIKLCLLLGMIYAWDFVFVQMKQKYGIEFLNMHLAKKECGIECDIRYCGLDIPNVTWNFAKRKLSIPEPDLSIKYKKFKHLLTLSRIQAKLKLKQCVLELNLDDVRSGVLKIEGFDKLQGVLNMKYSLDLQQGQLIFKKTSGSMKILPLKHSLRKQDAFEIDIKDNKITLDSKKMSFILDISSNLLRANFFVHSPVLQGEAELKIGIENECTLDLRYVDMIHFFNEIRDLVGPGEAGDDDLSFMTFGGTIDKAVFNNKKAVKNISIYALLRQNRIEECQIQGYTESNSLATIQNKDYGVLFADCGNAADILDLFSPGIIKNGFLSGNLCLETMKWGFHISHSQLPMLSQIQIKHLASPMRWIRLMITNPSEVDSINGCGSLSSDFTKIVVENIKGDNSYYNLSVQGEIDFLKNQIDLAGKLSAVDVVRKLIPTSNENPFKDSIKFSVKGDLLDPKFNFQLAPWSVISAIIQPILY